MILSTHGFVASSIGQFDADAVAFFNRVTTAGGTLSATEQTAINTLVLQMKTGGIWTKMKAIYPMVGASAAACSQNLKSSSFTGNFTSGWTFASTGATPNGTSSYMNTGLLPSASLTNNNTHLSFYSRTNSVPLSGEMVEIGAYEAPTADLFEIQLRHSNDNFITSAYNFTTFRLSSSNSNSQGFFIGNRSSSTSLKNFKNGTLLGTNSATNTTNVTTNDTKNLFLAAINAGSINAQSFSNRQCAFASIGDGLTDTEASNFYTAVQAFQTTLNRQVS